MDQIEIMCKAWVIDPCPDANGHWTIRVDDGSEHGDISIQPLATVYDLSLALHIIAAHNDGFDGIHEENQFDG